MRQPFFGPNAKPFFIQLAVGVAAAWLAVFSGIPDLLGDLAYQFSCHYITGSCLTGPQALAP